MLRVYVLFKSKSVMSSYYACEGNMLKSMTFVIEKLKFVSFSLFLGAFSPPPPLTQDARYIWCVYM